MKILKNPKHNSPSFLSISSYIAYLKKLKRYVMEVKKLQKKAGKSTGRGSGDEISRPCNHRLFQWELSELEAV